MSGTRGWLVFLVLGSAVLAVMSVAAHSMAYFPGDIAIARAVQAYNPAWMEPATAAVSWWGYPPQSNILFGSILVLLLVLGQRLGMVAVLVAALGSGASYFFLQQVVDRARPTEDLIHVAGALPMSGYPSGHLATFTAVFGVLAFLGYTALRRSRARWLPVGLVVVLLFLMGFARLFAGQHWPSDVLAGCLIGALWMAAATRLYVWAEGRFSRSSVFPSARRYLNTASTRR